MNNRKTTPGRKRVTIFSEPLKIFKEKYLTNKGKKLLALATKASDKKLIRNKYTKNRYVFNKYAKILAFRAA